MLLEKFMIGITTALGEDNKSVVCGICCCIWNRLTTIFLKYGFKLDYFNMSYQSLILRCRWHSGQLPWWSGSIMLSQNARNWSSIPCWDTEFFPTQVRSVRTCFVRGWVKVTVVSCIDGLSSGTMFIQNATHWGSTPRWGCSECFSDPLLHCTNISFWHRSSQVYF